MSDVIERANAALDGVTPGPWEVVLDDDYVMQLRMSGDSQMGNARYYPWVPDEDADWHFIAAARQLVPDMRDEITALRARVAELEARRPEMTP